jgi:hypothetical protein
MQPVADMLKAVIASVLLTSSSVAVADTPYDYNRSDGVRAEEGEQRDSSRRFDRNADWRNRPVTLASDVVLTNRGQFPAWVPVDSRLGLRRIQLQLKRGRAFIDNVTIVFADGRRQNLPVREAMSQHDRLVTIHLPQHHEVRGILIDSAAPMRSARGGGYRRDMRATINVVGMRR